MADTDPRAEKRIFPDADTIIFACFLSFCALVGVLKGCKEMRERRKEGIAPGSVAMGGRSQWSLWVAAQSFLHGAVALPFLLGIPGEIYCFGITFLLIMIGYVVGAPVFIHLIMGRLHKLRLRNIYEYFSLRFNPWINRLVSGIFVVMSLLFIGTIVFAQGLIFSQLTGLDMATSILIVRLVGVAFTAVGGVKAVIWLDVLHLLVIVLVIILITMLGAAEIGGLNEIMDIARAGERIGTHVWNFKPELARHSFWSQVIGGAFFIMIIFSNQLIAQKYIGQRSSTRLYLNTYISVLFSVLKMAMFGCLGVCIYAYYYQCDPFILRKVGTPDQLVPALMLDTLEGLPGFAGFAFASILTASLGTISASLNTLAAIVLMDFIEPMYTWKTGQTKLKPCHGVVFFKLAVILGNVITLAVPYLCLEMRSTLTQMTIINLTIAGGPILGLFFLGIFVPFANSWGAFVGMVTAVCFNLWVMIGAIVTDAYIKTARFLDLSIEMCRGNATDTSTSTIATLNEMATNDEAVFSKLYELSYMWIGSTSVIICVFIGILTSLITGWRSLKTLVVDPDLCVPYGFPVKDKLDRSSSRAALALNDMTEDKEEVNAITNGRVHSRLPESPRQRNRSYSAPSIGQDISLKSVESFGSLYYTNMEMFNYSGLVWFNKDDMVTRL